jgi:UPF0716 protein FxsA
MKLTRWILLAIVGLPLAELLVFALVASEIGWIAAFARAAATSMAGILILKRLGRAHIQRVRGVLADGVITQAELDGTDMLTALGGILLVLPGFITDAIGAALLVTPVRAWLRGQMAAQPPRGRGPRRGTPVLDLERDEWHSVGGPDRARNRPD